MLVPVVAGWPRGHVRRVQFLAGGPAVGGTSRQGSQTPNLNPAGVTVSIVPECQ